MYSGLQFLLHAASHECCRHYRLSQSVPGRLEVLGSHLRAPGVFARPPCIACRCHGDKRVSQDVVALLLAASLAAVPHRPSSRVLALQGFGETHPHNPKVVSDMTALHHIHEASILYNLRIRSAIDNQRPYTFMVRDLMEPCIPAGPRLCLAILVYMLLGRKNVFSGYRSPALNTWSNRDYERGESTTTTRTISVSIDMCRQYCLGDSGHTATDMRPPHRPSARLDVDASPSMFN